MKLRKEFVLTLFYSIFSGLLSSCSQPDFRDVDGNGITLKELHSKPLIVNYWATWCGPCIRTYWLASFPRVLSACSTRGDQATAQFSRRKCWYLIGDEENIAPGATLILSVSA